MIARLFDQVTLFVRDAENQAPGIRYQLEEDGIGNVEIVPVADMRIYKLISRPSFHARLLPLYYFLWLWHVFFLFLRQRTWEGREFLFHVTWTSDWIFSPLFLLPFRKRIIGPTGSQPSNFNKGSFDYFASRLRVATKTLFRIASPNLVNALRADGVVGIADSALRRYPWNLARNRAVVTQVFCELRPLPGRLDERMVLFIGKHLPFKNIDLFLLTTRALLAKDPSVAIHIFGDPVGTTQASDFVARHRLGKNVVLHGMVPQEEVGRYLSGYRTVLLQTSSECGGTVGVEAISMGAPVVCARGYGLDAFFDSGAYPHSVTYRNSEQFTEDASNEILRVFAQYEKHSGHVIELAQKFSFSNSVEALRRVVDYADKRRATFRPVPSPS